MSSTNTTIINELSDGGTDGTRMGATTTDLIGFLGVSTLVARQTATTAPSTTASASVSATQWCYSTSAQADAIVACLRAINTALTNYGMIA